MGLYDNIDKSKPREVHYGEKMFMMHYRNTQEGKETTVDNTYTDIPMIVQKHTNPLNKNLHDMKAKYLDSTGDFMHMGNLITYDNSKVFMAVTEPSSNGIYSEYKILPLTDDMQFTVDEPVTMKCVVANKGFYDEISYINDANVFEDKDTRATIVQYNPKTSQLGLFDDVYINNIHYKIVKIDNYTLKEYDEEFGVLQLVVIDTPFGEIKKNHVDIVDGVVMTARVKDRVLNALSRELRCKCNSVKLGDYIDFTYDRDKKGTMVTQTYLIMNEPTMSSGVYDTSLMQLCKSKMNLLDNEGNIVNVDVYFENNRMRIDRTGDGEFMKFADSSYMIIVQSNDATMRVDKKIVSRVIIDGKPYDVSGTDANSKGLVYIGLNNGKIDPNDDDEEKGVANYKSQMEVINGNKPIEPVNNIVGANELYKGYSEEYRLQYAGSGVTWSVDCSYIAITQDGTKCSLRFDTLSDANKTFTLKAKYGGSEFTKTILTKKL